MKSNGIIRSVSVLLSLHDPRRSSGSTLSSRERSYRLRRVFVGLSLAFSGVAGHRNDLAQEEKSNPLLPAVSNRRPSRLLVGRSAEAAPYLVIR